MHLKEKDISWHSLDDLRKFSIGTVRGYVNEKEFDSMVHNKKIHAEEAVDDITNLRKLLAKRIDMAVIDPEVMDYLIEHDDNLKKQKSYFSFDTQLLDRKDLFICFKKGSKYRSIFNKGLQKIDVDQIIKEYSYK